MAIKVKHCVGDSINIDICKELIEIDATSNTKAYKFKCGNGGPSEAVHLIVGNFMDKAVLNKARKLLLKRKGGFDIIFLL